MIVWTWYLKMSTAICNIAICLVCCSVHQAESGKLHKSNMIKRPSLPRSARCKEIAFKLETFLSEFNHHGDCTRICKTNFQILKNRVGKGFEGTTIRPALGRLPSLRASSLMFLDDCMYRGYRCFMQLSDDQLSDPELVAEPVFLNRKFSAAIELSKGWTVCHCGLTLKLWRVSRTDVTTFGAKEKTNCSNVEICKRLSLKFPMWPCIAETTIQEPTACTYSSQSKGYKSTELCYTCNDGIHAEGDCVPLDWSEEAQRERARAVAASTISDHQSKQDGLNDPSTADLLTNHGIGELRRLFGGLDDYHMLQLQMNQADGPSPSTAIVNQHHSSDFASSSQPCSNLLPSSSFGPEDYTPVPIESTETYATIEPTSIAHQVAELTSIRGNGKRVRTDLDPGDDFLTFVDLDELLSQRGRWEPGESSRSVGNRASFGGVTHSRNEARYTYANQYSHQHASFNRLSVGFPVIHGGAQQWPGSLGTSGQAIQLDGSWSDILHQLGPEIQVLPDLASLGNSQFDTVLNPVNNPQQPGFDDLIDGGDPPVPDDNDLSTFYDEFP